MWKLNYSKFKTNDLSLSKIADREQSLDTSPFFPNTAPMYVVSPQNSKCCEAQSILIVVSHTEKRVPCVVVQVWKTFLDMQTIGLSMQTAA
jgi:hypothetical protein